MDESNYTRRDLMLEYDDRIGVAYYAPTGTLLSASSEVIKRLIDLRTEYEANGLEAESSSVFTVLCDRYLANKPKRRLESPERIDQTDRLELVRIMVSTDCNLRCRYCYANGGSYGHDRKTMSPRSAIAFIRSLVTDRYKRVGTVTFFGGEPTLSYEAIRAVCTELERLVQEGQLEVRPRLAIVTNGTLISDRWATLFSEYGFDINVSIDGPREIHDQLRVTTDGSGTYDRIWQGAQCLKRHKVLPVLAEVTYTKKHYNCGYSFSQLSQFIAKEFGIVRSIVVPCVDNNGPEGTELSFRRAGEEYQHLSDSKFEDLLATLDRLDDTNSLLYDDLFKIGRMIGGIASDTVCNVGLSSITIFPDGSLYPCHLFGLNRDFCMGSVANGRVEYNETVLHNLVLLKKSHRQACSACWQRGFCRGCLAPHGKIDPASCVRLSERNRKIILSLAKLRNDDAQWSLFIKKIEQIALSYRTLV